MQKLIIHSHSAFHTPENALKYVQNYFNITKKDLFTKKSTRKHTDPRALLCAIVENENIYRTRKYLIDNYDFNISYSSISKGIKNANLFYAKAIDEYKSSHKPMPKHPDLLD